MKLKRKLILITFCLLLIPYSAGCAENVKEPSVAGIFYPADSKELRKTVDNFLTNAERTKNNGKLIALISPHAGYTYSGQVAAFGYKTIKGNDIKKVILIGPSHHAGFKGASVYTKGSFKTPLGNVDINVNLAESLINESADVRFYPAAYAKEHSLEVQLPFLQTVLKDFTIVPVLIGSLTKPSYDHLISKLTDILDEKTLIIASTDLSHYHDYHKAIEMDSKIISAIERLSVMDVSQLLQNGKSEMCGAYPVIITLEVARRYGSNIGVLFKYANSGDVTEEKDRVVGYASIGLYKNPFTEEEKKELLELARKAITDYVTNGKRIELETKNQKFKTDGAVFVTIKKNGALRGCIGHVQAVMPLYQSVINNAIAACSADTRFPSLKKEELKNIDIEISILSPLNQVNDIKEIQVGKHGLVIRKGMHQGLLLPQVAEENRWDSETFLNKLCNKAGLPENAWKNADLYYFTVEIVK